MALVRGPWPEGATSAQQRALAAEEFTHALADALGTLGAVVEYHAGLADKGFTPTREKHEQIFALLRATQSDLARAFQLWVDSGQVPE